MDIQNKIQNLPQSCGVYIFRDRKKKVLYIGKALNIKKRVQNHFSSYSFKSNLFLKQVYYIDYILTPNQSNALLLEQALIKELKPLYNIDLKDDKSYPYVVISEEMFPRVSIERFRKSDSISKIFIGPFTNKKILKEALYTIRKIFGFRTCKKMNKNACLNYHLNLCPAPCIGKIDSSTYNKNIERVIMVLSGRRKDLIEELSQEMNKLSLLQRFEEAKVLRDQIKALISIYEGMKGYMQDATLLKDVLSLKRLPRRIESIDISQLAGDFRVGSVVCFLDGEPLKSEYRRYRIKYTSSTGDTEILKEVVYRRYRRLLEEKRELPDLIIIDGGKAHLNVSYNELKKLGIDGVVDIISIAKGEEKIYTSSKKEAIILSKNNWALQLVQRIRNEAHRFAKKYHKLLRRKSLFNRENV